MGLDERVLAVSVLSKLPLTGKQQLMLLIIAKTHLMTDKLAEPSTQKGLAPDVGSSEKKNVWHWEEKGEEKTEINGRIFDVCISLCSIQSSSHLCSFRNCYSTDNKESKISKEALAGCEYRSPAIPPTPKEAS